MLHFSQMSQQSTVGPSSQCSSQQLSNKLLDCYLATPLPLSLELSDSEDHQLRDISNQPNSMAAMQSQPCSQMTSQVTGTQEFCTPADDSTLGFRPTPVLSPNRAKRPRPCLAADTPMQEAGGTDVPTPCTANGSGRHSNSRIPLRPRQQQPQICMRNVFMGGDFDGDSKANAAQARLPSAHSFYGRYKAEFKEEGYLGQGSFAQVVKVKHRFDGREYAIKRSTHLVCKPLAMAKWRQEVHAWSALPAHKSLVRYYGSWQEADPEGNGDHVFIQLERCGSNLADFGRIARSENDASSHNISGSQRMDPMLDEATLITVLGCMAEALVVVHGCKMVHLDIKPDNIYASSPEGSFKLGDFGMATTKTAAIHEEGDARYLAREILHGDTRQMDKGDMFALGASLYELASGCPLPQEGVAYQDLREGRLKLLPVASDAFRKMVADLMHPEPEHRPSARKVLMSSLFRKSRTVATQHTASARHRATLN